MNRMNFQYDVSLHFGGVTGWVMYYVNADCLDHAIQKAIAIAKHDNWIDLDTLDLVRIYRAANSQYIKSWKDGKYFTEE